jgi:putative phage-type endonuclease
LKAQTLDLEQGSQEWLDARKHHFCASEAPAVMSVNLYFPKNPTDLAKQKLGYANKFVSQAMKEGQRLEPIIRQQVEDQTGIGFVPAVMVKDNYLASLDGINFYGDTILEIKAPQSNNATVKWAIEGRVILPHQYQIQHQLMVSGADKCIYAVRNPEDGQIITCDVFPDQILQKKLKQAWKDFEPLMDLDENELSTHEPLPDDLAPLIEQYLKGKELAKEAAEMMKTAQDGILADLDERKSYQGMGLKVQRRTRKGGLDKKLIELTIKAALGDDIDLDKYTKPSTNYTVLEVMK